MIGVGSQVRAVLARAQLNGFSPAWLFPSLYGRTQCPRCMYVMFGTSGGFARVRCWQVAKVGPSLEFYLYAQIQPHRYPTKQWCTGWCGLAWYATVNSRRTLIKAPAGYEELFPVLEDVGD